MRVTECPGFGGEPCALVVHGAILAHQNIQKVEET